MAILKDEKIRHYGGKGHVAGVDNEENLRRLLCEVSNKHAIIMGNLQISRVDCQRSDLTHPIDWITNLGRV